MKKAIRVILLLSVIITSLTVLCVSAAEGPVSPGPAPLSGDGIEDGNQDIQPDTPGKGPAPNAGSGLSEGSGFP